MGLDLRLLIPAGAGWVALLALLTRSTGELLVLAGLFVAAALGCLSWNSRRPQPGQLIAGLCCAACALTLTSAAGHLAARQVGPVPQLAQSRAIATLEAVVVSDPRVIASRGHRADAMVVVRLSVREVIGRGQQSQPRTPVLVFGDRRWLTVKWHERVRFVGHLGPAEPGDDVEAVVEPRSPPVVLSRPSELTQGVESLRGDLRGATDMLPADPRGLVPSLVIGDKSRMPSELDDDMRATGMTHLTAVSGTNVTIVLLAILWVCGWLRVPRRWRLPLCLVGLAIFVMLCRPEPSVVRASAMGVVGLLATSMARPKAAAPALAAAILALLCVDPWLATSYGFALSVLATLGLLLFARPWGEWFARCLPERLAWLGEAIAIPVAAQAVCAPVIVLLQGSVSVVGVPANLIAAPLVTPATLAGVATVVIAPISTTLAYLPAWLAGIPAWGIALVAHTFAGMPFGTLPWPDGALGAFVLAAITLGLLFLGPWLAAASLRRPWVAAASAVLLVAAWVPTPGVGWPAQGWVFVACDVGQGDGGVLRTGPDRAVLIDVGPDQDAMDGCLKRLGVNHLDAVVLTHFHADHVAGLAGALRGRTATEVFTTPVHTGSPAGAPARDGHDEEASQEPLVSQTAQRYGVPARDLMAGDVLRWAGVEARVRWPARVIREGSVQNNASVVLDVTSSGLRMLFLGDAEREAQANIRRSLLQDPGARPITVLKVAHHGSANQDPALMKLIRAPIALVSLGADNDYGHPAPKTLDLLRDSGSTVYRTDRGGDVAVVARDGRPMIARP